jgi:hypothetical protein
VKGKSSGSDDQRLFFETPHAYSYFAVVPVSLSLDRFTATQVFVNNPGCAAYSYDDIIVMPGHINFPLGDVDISTDLTRNIKLQVPFVSSPMDTVTEHKVESVSSIQTIQLRTRLLKFA